MNGSSVEADLLSQQILDNKPEHNWPEGILNPTNITRKCDGKHAIVRGKPLTFDGERMIAHFKI